MLSYRQHPPIQVVIKGQSLPCDVESSEMVPSRFYNTSCMDTRPPLTTFCFKLLLMWAQFSEDIATYIWSHYKTYLKYSATHVYFPWINLTHLLKKKIFINFKALNYCFANEGILCALLRSNNKLSNNNSKKNISHKHKFKSQVNTKNNFIFHHDLLHKFFILKKQGFHVYSDVQNRFQWQSVS